MKKIFLTILITSITASLAFAAWNDNFQATYQKEGIDKAVIAALEEGIDPNAIIVVGQALEGLNPQNLLKALYCAGADGNDIGKAALDNGISELILTAAYEKSVEECKDQMADTQPYTPVRGPNFVGMPAPRGSSDTIYASASTF
ncbi:MAG: hypothetical protein KKD01_09025 [Proteobacteria bacterium]|nr:hypothetical protein [Pseudomonadota bacterium]MBU1233226.1 hypothetical protein [Pseudomonadota bacterium]MBU1420041.1 hypothetical protein [Pseudomonadota bacterium]MBU1454851.1 hypothetical protein [Pseudomonadota bacterium]